MKIVIIGNNISGTFTAQNIRSLNDEVEIEVYTQEKYPYYTRVKLPELISQKVTIDDLIVFNEDWYKTKQINLHLKKKITTPGLFFCVIREICSASLLGHGLALFWTGSR